MDRQFWGMSTGCHLLDSHLYAVRILTVQGLHSLDSFRNRPAATDEDTVDIEGEGVFVGRCRFWRSFWS